VLKSKFFSFYDIPDLIIKKKYQKKDYEIIMAFIQKVKRLYLEKRARETEDTYAGEEEKINKK